MRSNQIRTIQKRAKQRVLALAIGAVAFAGYGAISLFADDANAVTKTVTEMNKVPAIRSVGIRLISGSAAEKATSKEKLQAPQTTLPLANLVLPAPNLVLPEPSSALPESRYTSSALLPQTTAPTLEMNLPPITAAGRSELHPPPPMAEILNQSTNGKVLVKLSSDNTPSNTTAPAIAIVARVEPIRVSFGDSVKPEVPTDLSVASAPAYVVKNRLPVLVKPKPTQITHTVTLAQSTEIDLPTIDLPTLEHRLDENSTIPPSTDVVVKEQLAPQSLDKTRTDSRSNAEATPDGFVSLAPPSLPDFGTSTAEVKQVGDATPTSKLDSRWANGSPSAIIELESQSAKAMDIPGGIIAITVENEDVCRILHDAKTITLVGNQLGSTLVEIWTNEAKETPMLVRVNVSQPWQKSNSKPTDVRDVKHAVAQAFPKANINVFTNADGTLEVRGTTDSEDSAKRILEIVRKVCLVPVKDKVTVSR
ncbi:MAG: pilus assembly protein N-terminal domain-containing protein [Planctomycetota bacterium]|nr:pilus assembly protein N-terminal domain-containing protein [Planctomycetota bacterium]